jgi:hypothetical protein
VDPNPEVEIRPVAEADLPAILALYRDVGDSHVLPLDRAQTISGACSRILITSFMWRSALERSWEHLRC